MLHLVRESCPTGRIDVALSQRKLLSAGRVSFYCRKMKLVDRLKRCVMDLDVHFISRGCATYEYEYDVDHVFKLLIAYPGAEYQLYPQRNELGDRFQTAPYLLTYLHLHAIVNLAEGERACPTIRHT